jgi:hypothetical protein
VEGLTRCRDGNLPAATCPSRGYAVQGGPERDVHDHRFVGAGWTLGTPHSKPAEVASFREAVRNNVRSSVALAVEGPASVPAGSGFEFRITVRNLNSGHSFPTGSVLMRRSPLKFGVDGQLIYETGDSMPMAISRIDSAARALWRSDLIFNTVLTMGEPVVFDRRPPIDEPGALCPTHIVCSKPTAALASP